MFLFKKVYVFLFIFLGILLSSLSISCSAIGFLGRAASESGEGSYSSWEINRELRKELEDRELKYANNQELLGSSSYSSQNFEDIYDNKIAFPANNDPIKKFDGIENIAKVAHNTTYNLDELYGYAANFANVILENDNNILAWKTPSYKSNDGDWSYDSQSNSKKAIVYLQGGPVGDVSESGLKTSAYVHGKYGTMYFLNEGQFGLIPQEYVFKDQSNYLNMGFSNNIKTKIRNKSLSDIEAFNVLLKNEKFDLTPIETLLATSMALTKIEADKMSLIYDKLLGENYADIYFGGISHGFTVGVDTILFNENNLNKYKAMAMENNMLMPAQVEGERISGGILYPEDEETFDGNRSYVNPLLRFVRTMVKDIYGQKNALNELLKDADKNSLIKQKAHFKVSLNDFNVGNPTEEELRFYYKNDLNFTIKYKGGHNQLFSDEEYQQIFD